MTGFDAGGVREVSKQTYRVYVCCGKNCGPKGAPQLVDFLEEEVRRLSLQDRVDVYPGACQTHCETGPTVVVFPGPVYYQHMDRHRLQRVAREHLQDGRPVEEYFWEDRFLPRPREIKPLAQPLPLATNPHKGQTPGQKPKPKKVYEVDDFKW